MNLQISASEVREFVVAAFSRLSRREVEPSGLIELILIREGVYRGRSYRWGNWMANWLIDAHLVQFYNPRGDMVRTIDLREAEDKQRKAA